MSYLKMIVFYLTLDWWFGGLQNFRLRRIFSLGTLKMLLHYFLASSVVYGKSDANLILVSLCVLK